LAAERAAKSADLPPPTSAAADTAIVPVLPVSSYAPGSQFEARFGLFADGIGSAEQGTADLNGSFLTPRLNVGAPGYLAYLLPRFQLGGAVNLSGRTSFAYFDAAFTRRSRNGCSSSHSSAAPYITAVSPRRRPCWALAVRCFFTPVSRLAFLLLSIGVCSAPLSTSRTANLCLDWIAAPIRARQAATRD
jgi:hypothetical protein